MENEGLQHNRIENSAAYSSTGINGKKIDTPGKDTDKQSINVYLPLEMSIVGRMLKAFRKIRNLSQEKLGELVGVRKSQISKIEKGDRNLTLGTVIKLLKAIRARVTIKVELENRKELALMKQAIEKPEDIELNSK